jgi:O-antigen/teichoic acid export membrane protein
MSEVQMIPDTPDKEVDWTVDPDAGRELAAVGTGVPADGSSSVGWGGSPAFLHEVNRHFSRNVFATILARVVNMLRGVVLVPFVLYHLGLEAYGIWTTIFILVSYVGVTTLGLSNVYIKYVAEFHARREYDKANSLLSTGLAITIPLCSAIFLVFLFAWKWYAPWLHLPQAHAVDGKEAVLIVLGVFLSAIALNGFGDVLAGSQQIAATQWFLILGILVEFAAILWLVGAGRGIRGLAEAYLIRTVVADGLTIWWARKKLKWLRISPRLVRRDSIRYVLHFGGVVQFQSMLSIFLASVERVVALSVIGAAAAGLLDVAKKWSTSFSTVPMAFFAALLPAASHVDAASPESDRMHNLRTLYLSSSRYANLCTSAFVALFSFLAAPVLHVWLGAEFPAGQRVIALFVIFNLAMQFHMLTGPGTSMFRGMGRVYEEFTYSIPNLILLGLTLPAARWIEGGWTPYGIGVAVAVATIISACALMGRVLFVLHLPLTRFLRVVIVPGLAPYLIAGALAWPVAQLVAVVNRWQGAAVLLVAGIFYTAGAVAVLNRWVLTDAEKQKEISWYRRSLEMLRRREATA